MNILLAVAALACPATALVTVPPVLEIKPVGGDTYTSAEYVSCDVRSKALGAFFNEEVALKYRVPEGRSFRELQFLGPLPPSASVEKCEVVLDGKTYQSDVYTKFRGDEMYKNALETEAIAEVVKIGDLVYFRMKVSKSSKVKEIGIRIWWQQRPEVIHHVHLPSERLYVFPRKAYFKFGSAVPRSEANLVRSKHGEASFRFEIDFSGVRGWSIECDDDHDVKNKVYTIAGSKRDEDIIFRMKMEREERVSARHFVFDGHAVVELTIVPNTEVLRRAILCEREIVLVVDKSGSMGWGSGGVEPYKLVSEAIEVFLSTVCDLNIHVNVVFFDHECRESDMLFRGRSEKLASEHRLLDKKEWVKDMARPRGGTCILEGLQRAVGHGPVAGDGSIRRNIILLTDGGDSNLRGITGLVQREAEKGTRFFAIGIGNGVSYDTVMEVSRVGKGAHDFLRDACDIGPCLSSMLEKTGATESVYSFDIPNYVQKSITHFVTKGSLNVRNKTVQVPSKKHVPTLFTNERYVMYLVLQGDLPEHIELRLNGEKHRVGRGDIETCSDEKAAEALRREFAHSVDREFYLELYEEYDKRIQEHADLVKKRESRRLEIGDVERAIPRSNVFWSKYKNQFHFVMKHRLLTPDTALMLGDRLEGRDDWTEKGIEPIIKQYINNYSEEQGSEYLAAILQEYDVVDGCAPASYSLGARGILGRSRQARSLSSRTQTDSCSSLGTQAKGFAKKQKALGKSSGTQDPVGDSSDAAGGDTVCGKALLSEKEARDLLPRLLRVFDANTKKSLGTLASELASLLATYGVDRELVASILSSVQSRMAGSTEKSLRHEMMGTLVERFLGTSNKMNASLVTYARAVAAAA